MTILVTGATGFIGPHLAAWLAHGSEPIRALVRAGTDASTLDALGVEVVRGDVRDPSSVGEAVAGCRLVYHLAARTSHGNLPESEMYAINTRGTANVARAAAAAGVERLVHSSTARVYGIIRNHEVDENTPIDPDSAYPESKAMAEEILREHGARGLSVVVARITAVFGPGSKSWLPLFRQIAAGRFRPIGRGGNYHHPGDIADIVDGLVRCGTVEGIEGRTYILTGSEPVRLREMLELIARELGTELSWRALPGAPLHLYKWLNDAARVLGARRLPKFDRVEFYLNDRIFDITRARKELGFAPAVGVRESIRRTAEWYRARGLLSG